MSVLKSHEKLLPQNSRTGQFFGAAPPQQHMDLINCWQAKTALVGCKVPSDTDADSPLKVLTVHS